MRRQQQTSIISLNSAKKMEVPHLPKVRETIYINSFCGGYIYWLKKFMLPLCPPPHNLFTKRTEIEAAVLYFFCEIWLTYSSARTANHAPELFYKHGNKRTTARIDCMGCLWQYLKMITISVTQQTKRNQFLKNQFLKTNKKTYRKHPKISLKNSTVGTTSRLTGGQLPRKRKNMRNGWNPWKTARLEGYVQLLEYDNDIYI